MFREILQSKLFTGAALVIIGFFLVSIIKFEPPLITIGRELKNVNQKIDETQNAVSELEKLGDYLKDDAYLERQARLKLNYKRPDEKVVFVYRNPNAKTGALKVLSARPSTNEISVLVQNNDIEARKILDSKLLANLKEWWEYLISR